VIVIVPTINVWGGILVESEYSKRAHPVLDDYPAIILVLSAEGDESEALDFEVHDLYFSVSFYAYTVRKTGTS
jgi:hypothetical protein